MKIKNVHPCGDIAVIIPGDNPRQLVVKAGEVLEATKAEAAILLATPDNFEPVHTEDKE